MVFNPLIHQLVDSTLFAFLGCFEACFNKHGVSLSGQHIGFAFVGYIFSNGSSIKRSFQSDVILFVIFDFVP